MLLVCPFRDFIVQPAFCLVGNVPEYPQHVDTAHQVAQQSRGEQGTAQPSTPVTLKAVLARINQSVNVIRLLREDC
eukprot:Skav224578  [mRNA]  locus=scaffold246:190825:197078:+ [translate_table: standard]